MITVACRLYRKVQAFLLLALLYVLSGASVSAGGQTADSLHLIITVDTETTSGCGPSGCFPDSMESRILGQQGERFYGIPLMMDILESYDMRATFFVNAYLDAYYDEEDVREIVSGISGRGHDVQLHTHEEFRCFKWCEETDKQCWHRCTKSESYMGGNSFENQLSILKEGALNIERWSGRYPVAFRAGAFDADFTTLSALKSLGIHVDSSLNDPSHTLATELLVNRVSEYDGVVEVPLYDYLELDIGPIKKYRMFDIESTTLLELKHLLDVAIEKDLGTIVLLMHSVSFCRPEMACPIQDNIDRFDKFLAYVRESPGVKVITMDEFWRLYSEDSTGFTGSGYVPETGYFMTLYRSFVRFDQGAKNRIFVGINVAALLVFLLLAWFVVKRFRRKHL